MKPMASEEKIPAEVIDQIWSEYLNTGALPDFIHVPWYQTKRIRSFYHYLPNNPRCRLCHTPFKGIGGAVMRTIFGLAPSRMNPLVCNQCDQFIQKYKGGAEVELTVLFADVRGSTHMAENMNPTEFSRLINRFYNAATKVLYTSNAMVEKLIGDAVTGFFTPGFSGFNHALLAVNAAREILHATGHHDRSGPWIPVGIGVHTGLAYVGAVVSDSGLTDIAVFGDTANTGARLAAQASAGEIHVSQATAQSAGLDPSGVDIRHQTVKGRSEPIDVWVLS
jgi:adenylate cyclase